MLPLELHSLFSQDCACEILRRQRDIEAYKLAKQALTEMKKDCLSLITPRVEQEGKKIVNRTGILRRGL